MSTFYRGGSRLTPRRFDVRFDRQTGRVLPRRGLSVYDRPDHPNLAKFGGAYRVEALPAGLKVVQIGEDPSHHEVVPVAPVTWEEYERLVQQIVLVKV